MGDDKDVHLGVVSYNQRAIAFYKKWGFEVVPDSEKLYDDLLPEIEMVRRASR